MVIHGGVVYLATIMVDAIAHNEVVYFQNHVVTGNLIEYGLRNLDTWSLVLYNEAGIQVFVEKNRVATFFRAV